MKKSVLALGLLLSFSASTAFGASLYLVASSESKISKGGVKRVGGLFSVQDVVEDNSDAIEKSAPMQALAPGKSVLLLTNGYELRHINDNGREKFELTIKTLAGADGFNAGFANSVTQIPSGNGTSYIYNDTNNIVITTSNYPYLKDLVASLANPQASITCLIEKGQVVNVLEGETSRHVMKIEKVSCH